MPGSGFHGLRTRLAARGGRAVGLQAVLIAAGWWILAGGSAWWFGVPVVAAALVAGLLGTRPVPPLRWRLGGLVGFAAVFLIESWRGGIDVARRALAPRLPITPAVVIYESPPPVGPARQLFLGAINLMPGTLAIGGDDDRIELHVLAPHDALEGELDRVAYWVSRAMGLPAERPVERRDG